ncbi:MAG: hypothetical protein WBV40_14295 [Candidatus Cybelea sp.]
MIAFVLALVFLWIRVPNRNIAASVLLTIAILAVLARLWPWITRHLGPYDNDWATAGVALVAFALAMWQYRGSVAQTVRDFRWKQAEKANELGDLLLTGKAIEALNMIDYKSRTYKVPRTGEVMSITTDEALKALQRTSDDLAVAPEDSATKKAVFIRDCFDDLLNKLDRIYSLIEIKYVLWLDIAVVLRYYLEKLREDGSRRDIVLAYCKENGNTDAAEIIRNKDDHYSITPQNRDERGVRNARFRAEGHT